MDDFITQMQFRDVQEQQHSINILLYISQYNEPVKIPLSKSFKPLRVVFK
jgi:hypothetical protein